MTLVEVLVVLVLVGVMAASVGLTLGTTDRQSAIDREIRLLSARLSRATERALITGRPAALVWEHEGYRFLEFDAPAWQGHGLAAMADPHVMSGGVRLSSDDAESGEVAIRTDLFPDGAPSRLTFRSGSVRRDLIFDGLRAMGAGT